MQHSGLNRSKNKVRLRELGAVKEGLNEIKDLLDRRGLSKKSDPLGIEGFRLFHDVLFFREKK